MVLFTTLEAHEHCYNSVSIHMGPARVGVKALTRRVGGGREKVYYDREISHSVYPLDVEFQMHFGIRPRRGQDP